MQFFAYFVILETTLAEVLYSLATSDMVSYFTRTR